jgi:hypothetical protein
MKNDGNASAAWDAACIPVVLHERAGRPAAPADVRRVASSVALWLCGLSSSRAFVIFVLSWLLSFVISCLSWQA